MDGHMYVADNKADKGPSDKLSWKQQAQQLRTEVHVFYFVSKHPRTRWYARLVAACTAGYLFSPIQLIPNFIPVIGILDDVLVLFLGAKLLRKITPPEVLAECRERARIAEVRRKDAIKSTTGMVTSIVIVILWLVPTVAAVAVTAYQISR